MSVYTNQRSVSTILGEQILWLTVDRAVENEIPYINTSRQVSPSFLTPRCYHWRVINLVGHSQHGWNWFHYRSSLRSSCPGYAGRPVAHAEDCNAQGPRSSPSSFGVQGRLASTAAVFKKRKITDNVAQKILKDKSCPVPSVDAVYMQSYSRTRSARRMKRLVWS